MTVPKLVYKFSNFSRCNDTCTSFSKCYIIKQLLTNEALDMIYGMVKVNLFLVMQLISCYAVNKLQN